MNQRDLRTREVIVLAVAPFVVVFSTIAFPGVTLPAILAVVAALAVLAVVRAVGRLTDPQRDRHSPSDRP